MARTKSTLTINVSQEAIRGLYDLAADLNYFWGGRPNISQLMEAIGKGEHAVVNLSDAAQAKGLNVAMVLELQAQADALVRQLDDVIERLEDQFSKQSK